VPGLEMLLIAEIDQRVEPVHRDRDDRAAASAVAAVGAAELDELLAPEAEAAVAAVAPLGIDFGFIEELHDRAFTQEKRGAQEKRGLQPFPLGSPEMAAAHVSSAAPPTRTRVRLPCGRSGPRDPPGRTGCGRGQCRRSGRHGTWYRAGARGYCRR